ncbi:MAG: hypothetical protein ACR2PA_12270 [Hyphomicrobiaceae bacterium]
MTARLRDLVAPLCAVLALTYLVVMANSGAQPERTHLIKFEARGVMAQNQETIVRATVAKDGNSKTFVRQASGWIRPGETKPVSAELAKSISLAVKFMHTAEPVRVLKGNEVGRDASTEFGLSKPSLTIRLHDAHGLVLEAFFGDLNSEGMLHYMRARGRNLRKTGARKYYLMSRFVQHEWQAVFDRAR